MGDVWMLLLLGLLALISPIIAIKRPSPRAKAQLDKSFKTQAIDVDGTRYTASDFEVLYRKEAYFRSQGYGPKSYQLDAEWILRAPNGGYVFGIAQSDPEESEFGIRWTWRRLTEERARHALLHDAKAYRSAFGESPSDKERGGAP
ncbi:hypothetical protein [Dyella sp. GSA-30]|uniref:hypothetical protein n=1 Tax=Dyella sp. GSA-30 TaxID=2994496 RepID=UPI002491BFBD|nr:hypothetical protein [Dyella sp. GSA-30]BDU19991.1 hypothetical protein DYGSA30_14480 [Dyella sp. GSA-30]